MLLGTPLHLLIQVLLRTANILANIFYRLTNIFLRFSLLCTVLLCNFATCFVSVPRSLHFIRRSYSANVSVS